MEVLITDSSKTKAIADVKVSAAKVAGLDENGDYHLTEDFKDSKVLLSQLSHPNNSDTSKVLYSYARVHNVSSVTAATNALGKALFDKMDKGVYLVYSEDTKKVTFAPYLVFLPRHIDGTEVNNVSSAPKTNDVDPNNPDPDPDNPPIGGDGRNIQVVIIWDDLDDKWEKRPDDVVVKLYRDGVEIKNVVITPDSNWKHTFKDVPVTGSYRVEQSTVDGYTINISGDDKSGFVINNNLRKDTPGGGSGGDPTKPDKDTGKFAVQKIWQDNDNELGVRPKSVAVQLVKDNQVVKTVTLSESVGWAHVFTGLSLKDKYTVYEIPVKGYKAAYSGSAKTGITITNEYTGSIIPDNPDPVEPDYPVSEKTTEIKVTKSWKNNDSSVSEVDFRPDYINVSLISGGSVYRAAKLSKENGWSYTFKELPVNLTYTVYEDTVDNYSAVYKGNAYRGFSIENTYTSGETINSPPVEETTPQKDVPTYEDRPNINNPPLEITTEGVTKGDSESEAVIEGTTKGNTDDDNISGSASTYNNKDNTPTGPVPMIPQTGINTIPMYLLIIIGAVLFLIGIIRLVYKGGLKGMLVWLPVVVGFSVTIAGVSIYGTNDYKDKLAGERSERLTQVMKSEEKSQIAEADSNPGELAKKYVDGYYIVGTVEIPKTGISLPVIDEWSYDKLQTAPCRYSGSVREGNFIILAHNYRSHFKSIQQLNEDDVIKFTDVNNKVYTYTVCQRETLNKRELDRLVGTSYDLTLFTCNNQGTARCVVRCNLV